MRRINIFQKLNSQLGFTLAEVLVTLAIVGVVAALTIPSLIQNSANAGTVAGVKKAQSILSQAYNSFAADGTTMDTVFEGNALYVTVLNRFITKLNVIKNCGNGTECFPNVTYKFLNGNSYANLSTNGYGTAILADGSSIMMVDSAGGCDNHSSADPSNPFYNSCGSIYVDINGFKAPNQLGRDLFFFRITRTGVFPYGSWDTNACVITGQGSGCASKILTDGAVNY